MTPNDGSASKKLSRLLRHNPMAGHGEGGWVSLKTVFDHCKQIEDAEHLTRIVSNDDKARYELDVDNQRIRATQGHSVRVDPRTLMAPLPSHITVVYHGTFNVHLDSIFRDGLSRMRRDLVHMCQTENTSVGRSGTEVTLKIDVASARASGIQFWLSKNGYVLAEHVPARFISRTE